MGRIDLIKMRSVVSKEKIVVAFLDLAETAEER